MSFDLSEIEAAERAAREEHARVEAAKANMQSAIAFLRAVKDSGVSQRAREILGPRIDEARELLDNCRNHDVTAVRTVAWMLRLEDGLQWESIVAPTSRPSKIAADLAAMVRSGLLEDAANGSGPIAALGSTYKVPAQAGFKEPEVDRVQRLVADLLSRMRQEIERVANVAPCGLARASEGVCVLYVPPQRDASSQEWRPGGTLFLYIVRGEISVLDVAGRIETTVREAMELGVKVYCNELGANRPPYVRTDNQNFFKKSQLLWYLIVRGVGFAEWLAAAEKAANLTPEQFVLDGLPGICLVRVGAPWRWEGRWFSDPVCLMERRVSSDGRFIKVLDLPPHLITLFDGCLGDDSHSDGCYPEGKEDFSGLPSLLGAMLKTVRFKLRNDAEKAAILSSPVVEA